VRRAAAAIGGAVIGIVTLAAPAPAEGPRTLDVRVHPSLKMTVVASGLRAPRGLLATSDTRIFVTEFSWTKGQGRLSRLDRDSSGAWRRTVVFPGLDRPFGLALGPDKRAYVGVAGTVFRFDPTVDKPTREDVIGGRSSTPRLPARGLHPLTQLLFTRDRSLLVSLGSDTNNCEKSKGRTACPSAVGRDAVAVVRRYAMTWPEGRVGAWTLVARGLRNSMGLAEHSSGTLVQVENGRDDIAAADPKLDDETLPHDELNVLDRATVNDYGWPHCYDNAIASPEFRSFTCARTTKPFRLLPAHSAPLGLTYWTGPNAPTPFAGRLIVSLHGYRDTGHRLIAFDVDSQGRPVGEAIALIDDWGEKELANGETQNLGGPVGVIPMPDGSLIVADDRNNIIVSLRAR
jgi:glucose/arabinose dehydrogenase